MSVLDLGQEYLTHVIEQLSGLKKKAEHGMKQVADNDLYFLLDEESNSIAMLIHHLRGNMLSRWTNFLTEDGEKASRNRPHEFSTDFQLPRKDLMKMWEEGWNKLFETLSSLSSNDLLKTVTIRNEPHLVIQAINRQLGHYSEHVGQILMLAKHLVGEKWNSPTIPREKKNQHIT